MCKIAKTRLIVVMGMMVFVAEIAIAQGINTTNGFQVRTGVNLALWLSQSEARGIEREQYISQADIETIVSMGFDHIRLPIDEEQFWDEDGTKLPEAFRLMHNAIKWAADANMRVIVDLHIIRSHHFIGTDNTLWSDPKEQDKLEGLWEQLSGELNQYPNDFVAYELMNEAIADDHEDWNKLVARLHKSLRKIEPERTIVIGSNHWQQVQNFPYLKVPENDPNIILSFHYYNPEAFTHYKTSWTPMKKYTGPVYYPGEVIPDNEFEAYPDEYKKEIDWAIGYYDKAVMQKGIDMALNVAGEHNLPLYCGEFGVYPTAPKDAALRWYKDLTDVFRENHIAFCHWEYKGDFTMMKKDGSPYQPLVDLLVE